MPKRKAITAEDAQNVLGGDALDRFTGGREATVSGPQEHQVSQKPEVKEMLLSGPPTKVTVYLEPHQIVALEELRLKRLKETGKTVKKSELIREAVDLLLQS